MRRTQLSAALLTGLVVLGAVSVQGQWRFLGPEGTSFGQIVVDSEGEWLGLSDSDAVLSQDGGETWTPLPVAESEDIFFSGFLVDPRPGGAVYAVFNNPVVSPPVEQWWRLNDARTEALPIPCDFQSFLFPVDAPGVVACWREVNGEIVGRRSVDNGLTWSEDGPIPASDFDDAPARLKGSSQLLLSTDGGRTFEPVPSPPQPAGVSALALDEQTFLAATWRGLYRTTDKGETWLEVNGLPFQPWRGLSQGSGVTLLWGATGVFESADEGATWTRVEPDLRSPVADALIDPEDPEHILGGSIYTDDGGETWLSYLPEPGSIEGVPRYGDLEVHPLNGRRILSQWAFGWRPAFSDDFGRTWQQLPTIESEGGGGELPSFTPCQEVRQDPTQVGAYYCVTVTEIWHTTDEGESWEMVADLEDTAPLVGDGGFARRMAVSHDGEVLWVLRQTFAVGGPDWELLVRGSSEEAFTAVTTFDASFVEAVEVDGADPMRVFVHGEGTSAGDGERPGFLFVWDGTAATGRMDRRFGGWVRSIAQHPEVPGRLLAGTSLGELWLSVDRGRAWKLIQGPWSEDQTGFGVLAVRWYEDQAVVATGQGAYVSEDLLADSLCAPGAGLLCLGTDGRFAVSVTWTVGDPATDSGTGVPFPITDDTGAFWFFQEDNLEIVLKVLDGCGINGYAWVFASGLTDVGVDLRVTDTVTGEEWSRQSPVDLAFQPATDTAALPCDGL